MGTGADTARAFNQSLASRAAAPAAVHNCRLQWRIKYALGVAKTLHFIAWRVAARYIFVGHVHGTGEPTGCLSPRRRPRWRYVRIATGLGCGLGHHSLGGRQGQRRPQLWSRWWATSAAGASQVLVCTVARLHPPLGNACGAIFADGSLHSGNQLKSR